MEIINKVTSKNNIKSQQGLYKYYKLKKIVTYVPLEYVDKLMFELGSSGAGIIGKYDLCSFRMKGLGTYRPGQGSNPFKGKSKKISFEEEVRIEMQCRPACLDNVINALLRFHPYEEPAYEIYDFFKRETKPTGFVITFKKAVSINDVIKNVYGKLEIDETKKTVRINKIAVVDDKAGDGICSIARYYGADYLLTVQKNKKLLIKL